jgi:hypothetical protein
MNILSIDEYRVINVAVIEEEENETINHYTNEGWDYCQSVTGAIDKVEVVYLKFSKDY